MKQFIVKMFKNKKKTKLFIGSGGFPSREPYYSLYALVKQTMDDIDLLFSRISLDYHFPSSEMRSFNQEYRQIRNEMNRIRQKIKQEHGDDIFVFGANDGGIQNILKRYDDEVLPIYELAISLEERLTNYYTHFDNVISTEAHVVNNLPPLTTSEVVQEANDDNEPNLQADLVGGSIISPFAKYTVEQLRNFITTFRKYHNITSYSKMKKKELVAELERRFTISNNNLYLK